MKQRLVLILAFTLMANISYSQLIDRYGLNLGTSYCTQIWDYKMWNDVSEYEYKFGIQTFLQAEKDFGNLFALRTELGYIQKGFKNNVTLTAADGTFINTNNDNVVLHNLALNLGLKIKPLKYDYAPYFMVGLRSNYMISYKDIEVEEPGSGLKYNMYEVIIDGYNKFNLGGLISLGIDIKDFIYFELEYNPNITKYIDDAGLNIKDDCWGAKIGLNINKLTE